MTDDQDEMRVFTRELFRETDETAEADEDDPGDTRPANQVPREGSNPGTVPVDDARALVRALFDN